MSEEIIKYLKNSIDEKGNYCYSLPVETTKAVIKELNRLNNIINEADNKNLRLIEMINKIWDVIENGNITGIEARMLIKNILEEK